MQRAGGMIGTAHASGSFLAWLGLCFLMKLGVLGQIWPGYETKSGGLSAAGLHLGCPRAGT
jgi:hypothetical protein